MALLRPYPPISEKPSKKATPQPKRSSALGNFVILAMLLVTGMLGYMVYLGFQAEDLSDIDGYQSGVGVDVPVANLLHRLKNESAAGAKEIIVSEKELNQYVSRRVRFDQTGALADAATVNGVAIRLSDGRLEVIFDRTIRGVQRTVASHVTVSVADGNWVLGYSGGKFGQLHVPGGKGMQLMQPAIDSLVTAFREELDVLQRMSDVRFEDDRMVVTPQLSREPGD